MNNYGCGFEAPSFRVSVVPDQRAPDDQSLDLRTLDLGHLALFVGYGYADEVKRELERHGFEGLTFSHGFVFQHLVEGERTIGELSARLGVTQQAASKVIAELLRLGYVERERDPNDARIHNVRLSERGRSCVQTSRRARARLERRLTKLYGESDFDAARSLLAKVLEELGGSAAVRQRRVRAPR
jgi:DNA-binding MarR family transcriptional regulator